MFSFTSSRQTNIDSSLSEESASPNLRSLDVLRGFLSAYVVAGHCLWLLWRGYSAWFVLGESVVFSVLNFLTSLWCSPFHKFLEGLGFKSYTLSIFHFPMVALISAWL